VLIVKNAVVYTNSPSHQIIWKGGVVVENGLITEVFKGERARGTYGSAEVIDASGKLLAPGFIDTHMHLDSAYLRGLIEPKWMSWLKTYFSWYFDLLNEDDFYFSSLFNIGKRLLSGTTTIVDAGPLPGYERASVKSIHMSGVRADLNRITMDVYDEALGPNGFASRYRETTEQALRRGRDFVKRYNGRYGRLSTGLCLMQVPTTSVELGREARRIADDLDGTLHTHAGVHGELLQKTRKLHGMGDVEYLDSIGVLCERLTAAHMGWVSAKEIQLVSKRRANVSHCPTSTTINGKGILSKGNIVRMLRAGVNLSLGTDELDVTDLTRVMFGVLVHRDIWQDSNLFPLEEVFQMATTNGAISANMRNRLGRIQRGMAADFVLYDLKAFDMVPAYGYSILTNLIVAGGARSVETVVVDGKILVRNGKVVSFDMEKVADEVQKHAQKFARAAVELGMLDKHAFLTYA
jgi:5-methylthioadenosine/S-adenosylhomocysteine deaminase